MLACPPGHRRRGLSRAIICEGMRRLQRPAAALSTVVTRTDNAASNQLYESAEFAILDRKHWCQKTR
ncbi:MAG: hypothetical protein KAX78_07610 [Phycisphaerae bacterium]|nr:hypothetical protein [Phycisphaerae bacterium]